MASKRKKHRRKTFKMPTDGPLYEPDDQWTVASPTDLPERLQEASPPSESDLTDARVQQLQMIRDVFGFEQLAWKGFKTVVLSILFFGVGTSLSGGLLGLAFPNYCRFIFGAFDRVDFQPWVGGLSHGLVTGALAGAIIGCVVVLSVAIYQSRTWKNLQQNDAPH
jgi:hypothetical protein